jgi:hypothetical protein
MTADAKYNKNTDDFMANAIDVSDPLVRVLPNTAKEANRRVRATNTSNRVPTITITMEAYMYFLLKADAVFINSIPIKEKNANKIPANVRIPWSKPTRVTGLYEDVNTITPI